MKNFIIHLFFVLVPCLVFSQRQFLDAKITTNNNQKISGKIAVENWLTTPRSIDFTNENGERKNYAVADLSEFEVVRHDGAKLIFIRRESEIEVSPYQIRSLDNSQELKFQKDTSWLQLTYRGSWSLYMMTDKIDKTHYFIETDKMPATELLYKPFIKQQAIGLHIEGVEKFRKQLYDLAQGCPKAMKLATGKDIVAPSKLNLQRKQIENVFKAYDKCNDVEADYILKDEKMLASVRIMAGRQFGAINLAPYDNVKFDGDGYFLGIGTELFLSNSNKRASIWNEVISYRTNETADFKLSFFSAYDKAVSHYEAWELAIYTMGSVRITKSPFSPKLKLGIINRFHISPTFKTDYYIKDNLIKTETTRNPKNGYEIGPTAGISMEYRRIGLNAQYSISNYLHSWGLGENANTRMLSFSASYKLF